MSAALGDRMKSYESAETSRRALPLIPIVARIDGRAFHGFTRGMERPFDAGLMDMMTGTTIALMEETHASMGYTQSDEITLAWHSLDSKSQVWFDGRLFKMTAQLAAHATLEFYRRVTEQMPHIADRKPTFDARVWQVPNRTEAANVFLWREWDATKNSIQMAAQTVFSNKQLHGKNGKQQQEMLFQTGINWNDYPARFKRGTFVQRRVEEKKFSATEIDRLPPNHEARSNPDLMVKRSVVRTVAMPPFASVSNREDVIFEGAAPEPQQAGVRQRAA